MRFEIGIRPRVSETDMLGHINNVAVVAWFEEGRSYMVREALGGAEVRLPPFVLARIEIDFAAQLFFGHETRVSSAVEKLGNSSVVVEQWIIQRDEVCARARVVLVHFDHATQRPAPLGESLREALGRYLEPGPGTAQRHPG
jgi:acyl-CoA thioester hydrolase